MRIIHNYYCNAARMTREALIHKATKDLMFIMAVNEPLLALSNLTSTHKLITQRAC